MSNYDHSKRFDRDKDSVQRDCLEKDRSMNGVRIHIQIGMIYDVNVGYN